MARGTRPSRRVPSRLRRVSSFSRWSDHLENNMRSRWLMACVSVFALGCGSGVSGGGSGGSGGGTSCPDPTDPDVHYAAQDPAGCTQVKLACTEAQTSFSDD